MKEHDFYRMVLKEELMNGASVKERVDAQTRQPEVAVKRGLSGARRAAVAIALVAALLAVGAAGAAVIGFSRANYTPDTYLRESAERRQTEIPPTAGQSAGQTEADTQAPESIPDFDRALAAAKPADVSYTIRMMPEIDADGTIANWRAYMEQPPYAEADWAWVRTLQPTIGDVLFDGNMLYLTTFIKTDRPEVFEWNTETAQDVWVCCGEGAYTVENDPAEHEILIEGESWYQRIDDSTVAVFGHVDLSHAITTFPTKGVVTMKEQLYVVDARADDMQPTRGAVGIIDFTFTFDASATRPVADTAHVSIPLSGTRTVTMQKWYLDPPVYALENAALTLDGVTLGAKIEYRPIGIYVTLTVESAPDGWTDFEKQSLLGAIDDDLISGGPDIPYRINGEDPLQPERLTYGTADAVYILLPVYPSEYEAVSSLTLDLFAHRITAVNGGVPTEEWKWSFKTDGEAIESAEIESEPLATLTIPIPKLNH